MSGENLQKDHPVLAALDVIKKPTDLGDDAWNASRGALPADIVDAAAPFIIGPLMLFIHFVEAYHGFLEAWEVWENWEKEKQRKTKFFVALTTSLIATAGVGLSVAYILAGAGAVTIVASLFAVLPIVLPAMLGAIYTLALSRKSYELHQVKNEENIAREEYLAYIKKPGSTEGMASVFLRDYQKLNDERLNAEKEVAMGTVEVFASIVIVTGIALSILTSGAFPLALLVTGVVIGTLGKLYEYVDTKYEGALSDPLRSWLGMEVEELPKFQGVPAVKSPKISSESKLPDTQKQSSYFPVSKKNIFTRRISVPRYTEHRAVEYSPNI